jgi:hypothetical protein
MPELEKNYPVTTDQWVDATPEDWSTWLDHIANEYLWSADDRAYTFLTTLGGVLASRDWRFTVSSEATGEAEVGETVIDDVVIDIRRFAVQKALELDDHRYVDNGAEKVVIDAKTIEEYLLNG